MRATVVAMANIERRAAVKLLLSGALAAGILAAALPRVAGAGWSDIGNALGRLSLVQLLLLAAVWLAGLWVHTPALTAALPGLSHRRALLLNLTGSFVSNLLPLGGAAGTVANWRMARSWGFASPAFARWAILTNLFDTALKLVLPGVALLWLAAAGREVTGAVSIAAYAGLGLLTLVVVAVWLLARDDRAVRWIGRRWMRPWRTSKRSPARRAVRSTPSPQRWTNWSAVIPRRRNTPRVRSCDTGWVVVPHRLHRSGQLRRRLPT